MSTAIHKIVVTERRRTEQYFFKMPAGGKGCISIVTLCAFAAPKTPVDGGGLLLAGITLGKDATTR